MLLAGYNTLKLNYIQVLSDGKRRRRRQTHRERESGREIDNEIEYLNNLIQMKRHYVNARNMSTFQRLLNQST